MNLQLATGRVERDGESIYWELASTGEDDDRPVVVLSHGAGGSHAVWFHQVPALGRDFRVLTWDSRGFGNSTNNNDAPSAAAAAADLAAVLDAVGVDAVHLVGQSMGGWHVSAFAAENPGRVLSLVYADTIGGLWTSDLRAAFEVFSRSGGLVRPGPTLIGGHRAIWSGTAERDPALAFLYQALGSFHSPPMHKVGETIAWSIEHQRIAELGVPVLMVVGEHDEIFPSSLIADSTQLIPGAEFVEITEAGHSPYFEQPEVWNHIVGSFLRSI